MGEQYHEGVTSRHTKGICIRCKEGTHSVWLGYPCDCAEHQHKIV
jgi:hypothetical protein